ncbi:MAG: restriction endonuclease subunit S [Roseiflexus sp.]|uniref:restriction endonuclease subunit S n=1 Tax=Roseiflexus sp. TaxID=2562120 RepID=UPI0025F288D9|nr:restriction endonuclease subunit S [Roseiflexus sp.]MCL6539182.1 restriction endonuclease subunit S [Roseiflexus sp.]
MSRLDWVNALPQRWEAKPLRAVTDYVVSNVDKVPADGEVRVRLCNYTDVYNNEFITLDLDFMEATATQAEIARFGLAVDDVIITKDSESWDDIAVPALVRETAPDLVCGYHLAILRPRKQHIHGAFLLRCLQAKPVRVQLELAANGVTRFGIPKSDIGSLRLPVPPLNVQRAIADYLDRETARIDALIAAKERLLALLAEKRRALITRAVTRGLDPNAPMKDSGIPWLGEIPAHWEIRQLKFVAINLQTGPFGTQLHAGEYITGGVPVVNPAHLKAGKIVTDERMTIDDVTAERLAIHRLKPGDLVLARRGEIGRCAVVEPAQAGWLCGTGSLRARLRREVANPYYLALMFSHTLVSDTLVLESVGSTMDNLNTEILGSCRLPIPPLDEQQAIVEHITEETARLDALRAATERSIALLKERRAALISAAVTGQIDVPACAASTADREAVP